MIDTVTSQALLIAQGLFWLSALGILLLPRRWALLCWFLAAQFDLSGISWQSASTLGWGNTLRVVILPSFLLLRFGWSNALATSIRLTGFRLWLVFCAYVAFASLWSPFPVSSAKLLGYLYAYTVSFIILFTAYRKGYLNSRVLIAYLWSILAVAMLQTWWLGNPFGKKEQRFTSFLSPQYFAQTLDFFLIIVVVLPNLKWRTKLLYAVILIIAIFLSGSRTGFLAGVGILTFASWLFLRAVVTSQRVLVASTMLLLSAGLMTALYFLPLSPSSDVFRTLELLSLVREQNDLTNIGTIGFRMGMWQATISELARADAWQLLFGHGTASGANVALWAFSRYGEASIDANRVIHNEFLRALYEWGLIGFVLFSSFLIALVIGGIKYVQRLRNRILVISTLATMLLFLAIENVLAAGGNAAGIALILNLALIAGIDFADARIFSRIRHPKGGIRQHVISPNYRSN